VENAEVHAGPRYTGLSRIALRTLGEVDTVGYEAMRQEREPDGI
jgi:hypothetical protein